MSGRRIYVDIDDVLSETIERLVDLFEELHDRRVEPEEVAHFDLARSFGLDARQIERFMERAHAEDVILSRAPLEGAAEVLARWSGEGRRVTLVTGRPPSTHEVSRRWLEAHGVPHDEVHHLDKWNRPSWNEEALPAIGFEDLPGFDFEFAIEDSLDTAVRLVESLDIPVLLMDRPWNRLLDGVAPATRAGIVRCRSWAEIARVIDQEG